MAEDFTDTPPDRLSLDPRSDYFDEALLSRGVGIKFNGQEKTNVIEYSISEGWIRIAAGQQPRPLRPADDASSSRARSSLISRTRLSPTEGEASDG